MQALGIVVANDAFLAVLHEALRRMNLLLDRNPAEHCVVLLTLVFFCRLAFVLGSVALFLEVGLHYRQKNNYRGDPIRIISSQWVHPSRRATVFVAVADDIYETEFGEIWATNAMRMW